AARADLGELFGVRNLGAGAVIVLREVHHPGDLDVYRPAKPKELRSSLGPLDSLPAHGVHPGQADTAPVRAGLELITQAAVSGQLLCDRVDVALRGGIGMGARPWWAGAPGEHGRADGKRPRPRQSGQGARADRESQF